MINFNDNNKILHSQFWRTLTINPRTLSHLWLAITFGPLKPVGNKRSHILTLWLSMHNLLLPPGMKMSQQYRKTIFGRYRLHSLHGQFCGHYFLIPDLKTLKVFTSFNSAGTISQILGPKNDRLSVPLYTPLMGGTEKCEVWRSWWFVFCLLKIAVNVGGTILLYTFNISVASIWGCLLCIGTDPSLSSSSLNDKILSLYITHKNLSCKWFILLFIVRLWHIQTSRP